MKSLTCFSSRSRGTCCAVILERLAENCRGRTTAIICTRTNAPKYILESHRLHFGSICDQNGRNFEPWTAATGQRRQCAHHTPATGGEERVIEPIKWMGIIRRPWLIRTSGGNLARTPGLHPTLYEKCHGIFNDHRESGPQFNVSSERRSLLTV